MPTFSPIILGITLLTLGLAASALTFVALRLVPQTQPRTQIPIQPPIPLDQPTHSDAVLLVLAGGKVIYLNQQAREWFNLGNEDPNLERLARHARPPDAFLGLCASEGQIRFSLDGRLAEGTSYSVPYHAGQATLVSLRRPQLVTGNNSPRTEAGQTAISNQAFSIFSELSQAMAASLDLESTIEAILEGIERLIPSDLSEITIWDDKNQQLIPYRFTGIPGLDRKLEKSSQRYLPGEGYSGYLVTQHKPLLISDVSAFQELRPASIHQEFSFNAYLGVPLVAAKDLVGTLELASFSKDTFTPNDLEILRILSGQAAVAVRNAMLYEGEQKRALEMSGLAQLAQTVSSLHDPQDLFARLVESIQPLMDVEILGFLLYDEGRRTLSAQPPFIGLQPSIIEWYQTVIHPDSPAGKLWESGEAIVSTDALQDSRLEALDLHNLAQVAGIQHAVLLPLSSGGKRLGYLLVADKRDQSSFNPDDLRLLAIIAGQAAPIIENASLVQQSRRRAQRAETLRRIASLTGSAATLDEVLKYSLQDLARLLQADTAAIFLLDEAHGELRLHKSSLFGVSPETAAPLGRISMDDPQFRYTVTGSQRLYLNGNVPEDPNVLPVYRPIVVNLDIRSAIVAPLIVRERGIGEVMIGSHKPEFFSREDVQPVSTAAGQLASSIEQATLYSQTDESLRRRVDQLIALTRISRELNTTLELQHLIQLVYDEALHTTGADCGTILLFGVPETGFSAGSSPKILLHLGDPHAQGLHPLEQLVLESEEAVIIQDFEGMVEFENGNGWFQKSGQPVEPVHAGVRSAMVVPIAYQEQVAGIIHLHAQSPYRFDQTAKEIVETLAIQAAIALGNAHRYNEQVRRSEMLSRRVETLAKLFETTQSLRLEQPLEEALENIAYAIQSATPFNSVLISVYDPATRDLQRTTGAGLTLAELDDLKTQPQPWDSLKKVLKEEFRIGSSFFIPYEQMPAMPADIHTLRVLPLDRALSEAEGNTELAWHPEDVLVVPLVKAGGVPLGLISVDAPRDNLRPDRTTIETLEIFASQASLVIESQNKLKELTSQVEAIQRDLALAQKTSQTARNQLPILEQKDLEQTLVIQRLSQRADRLNTSMEISETINRQNDRVGVLRTLGYEILTRLNLDLAMIAEPGLRGPRLLTSIGKLPETTNLEALLGLRSPLLQSLQNGEMILAHQIEDDSEWTNSPLLYSLEARGFICLPVLAAGGPEASILAISRKPLPPFTEEDEQLYKLIARQAAASLQNLSLLSETNRRLTEVNLLLDFSRKMGSLETSEMMQTLVESCLEVIPAAHAGMVSLWNPTQKILQPQAARGYGDNQLIQEITYHAGEALPGQVFETRQPVRLDEVDFARHYNISSENLMRYRNANSGKLPVSCMVIPIQRTPQAEPFGVLVVDNFSSAAAFSLEAQQIVTSLTGQTALYLEISSLYRASEQRADQLHALTQVAATITSSLQPDEVIASLLGHFEAILPYETGTLWLRQGDQLVVKAARGFSDSDERVGLIVNVEDSQLLNEMLHTGNPISVGDIRQDERFPSLMEYQNLSWLGLPLIASGEVVGVIALEKAEPDYYTPEHIQIATTFASQAAVALENANLYQESLGRTVELDQRSHRLEMLNRLSKELSESLDPNQLINFTIQELAQAIRCSAVSAVLFDSSGRAFLQAEIPATSSNLPQPLMNATLFDRLKETLGIFNTEDVSREEELASLAAHLASHNTRSLLALSLATGSQLHGVLLAHAELPYRFSAEEVGLARTISNQAGIAIQNARLYAETRSLTEDLDQRVKERTTQLAREHQRTETLLRIITELSASLDLEQVLNRTLKVLNEIVDAEQISALILRPGENKLHHLASVGYAPIPPTEGRLTPFEPGQGLAGWVIKLRQPALISDVHKDPRWMELPGTETEHRSAIGVPLMVGAEALGALLFFHREVDHFSVDQLDLIQAAANQVAIAVNNAELYRLIRDQAEDLGTMFRRQQIETSRSREILESVADGVLVTDASMNITLFNASSEQILGMKRSDVIGKSLEYFTGLFGGAAKSWMDTIHLWSQNPGSYQPGDVFAEQITLDDGRVVSVHLAPVSMRDDYLGTVSIFRDITHQVELDRLKSEFVATVSHELRTPMTSIKGYVDILLMEAAGSLNEQQAHFLEVVKNNTDRLTILVDDLLDISRIEAGRVLLSFQPLELDVIAREALINLEHHSQEENKDMVIRLEHSPDLPMAFGDLERVRQILDNLLDNAYNYTPEGGQVLLRLRQVENEIQIDVKDNGIGIPLELQSRVFERFYRGEDALVLATSGTGLGLSIVQHLVEMHQGRIWLESSGVPGEGSIFSFTLPIYTSEDGDSH